MTRKQLTAIYRQAALAGLVERPDPNAIRRAWAAYGRNRTTLGSHAENEENDRIIASLAVAQAETGIHWGWKPVVYRLSRAIILLPPPSSSECVGNFVPQSRGI